MGIFPSTTHLQLFIVDMLTGAVDMLLLIRLYYRIYGDTAVSRKKVYLLGTGAFIISALICRAILDFYRPTAWPPVTVLASLLLLPLFCHSSRRKQLLYSLFMLGVASLLLLVADLITSPQQNVPFVLLEASPHLCFWLIIELVRQTARPNKQMIPTAMYILLAVISVLCLGTEFIVTAVILTGDEEILYWALIFIATVLLFVNLSLFIFFDRFASYVATKKDKALLEQQLRLQQSHYSQVEKLQEQIRILHHDMKNNLQTAYHLSTGEEPTRLRKYLEESLDQIGSYEQLIYTGNAELDTIINMKLQELKTVGVILRVEITIPPKLSLSFSQAVAIFGNLLDNAGEACRKLEPSRRWVSLRVSYINQALLIVAENPLPESVRGWANGLPLSDKADQTIHGLGLKSIRKLVEGQGSCQVTAEDGTFRAEVILYDL